MLAKLVDDDFYFTKYPQFKGQESSALDHFKSHGWASGCDPSAEFEASYYLRANPDVKKARINPLTHWMNHGWSELRAPNPFVHPQFIRSYYPDAYESIGSFVSLLKKQAHFNALMAKPASLAKIRQAIDEDDHGLLTDVFSFDTKRYAQAQTDVAAAGWIHPIDHLFVFGLGENRLRSAGALHNLWGPVDSFATDLEFVSSRAVPLRNAAFLIARGHRTEAAAPVREAVEDLSGAEAVEPVPEPSIPLPLPAFEDFRHVMVGQPDRAVVPFAAHLRARCWQTPKDVGRLELEARKTELAHCDVTIHARDLTADWIASFGRAHWVLDRAPVDFALTLTTSSMFVPAWQRQRVRIEGASVVYAPEDEVAEWDDTTRTAYRAFGRELRQDLRRLQTAGRLARFNKVEIGRRFGPLGAETILVPGQETDASDRLQSNPRMVQDIDVVRLALLERPMSQILYVPQTSAVDNKAAVNAIRDLSDRVRVVEEVIAISEFAHVASEVRTVDSRLGLMVLAVGLPLVVHGRPSYAGLGLTRDLDASGVPVPACLPEALDLDTFLGWQFRACILFADPISGTPMDARSFIAAWTPFLGELSDEVAGRIVALACHPAQTPDDRGQYIRVLAAHAKNDHLASLVERIGNAETVKAHFALARAIALDVARRGDWQGAVDRVKLMWDLHTKLHRQELFDLLVNIRRTLSSTREAKTFGSYVVTAFRHLTSATVKALADHFARYSFYSAASTMYASCEPSADLAAAHAKCLIAIGDLPAAKELIAETRRRGGSIEELELALDLRREDVPSALSRLASLAGTSPTDLNLQLRLANAYRSAGRLEEARPVFIRLLRSKFDAEACRALGQIHITTMQTATAEGYALAHLGKHRTDASALRTLADVHLFENDLHRAGDALLALLKVNPLDVLAHASLTELEGEMKLVEPDGFGPWTREYDDYLADIDQHSAETLMAQGRARLQQHDLDTLRENCRQITRLFPADNNAHAWYAHALAWSKGAKSSDDLAEINRHYDISIAREREDNSWFLLDSIRSAAYFGDVAAIRRLTRENRYALYVADREKLVIPRFAAAAALGDFVGVFEAMRALNRTRIMRRNAHHFRLALSLDEIGDGSTVLLTSEGGVGDELRYSLIYPELVERLGSATITVDERLYSLFRRSYPSVERFVPLPRYHGKRLNKDFIEHIGELPDRELGYFFNDEAWKIARERGVVAPIPCLLADLRRSDQDFERSRDLRLQPDPDLVRAWRERLSEYDDRLIVGVTWTSMMRQYQRVGNYLSHEEMEPLFRTPGAVFVNCQYEPIAEELRWAREVLGIEIVDFPDLDKRDDFENLAALIANLDLFIGTGTTTTEFAGLVGCDTIYASFSMMNAYRNPAGTERDRFIDGMRIVSSVSCGREAAMARIKALLDQAIDTKRRRRGSLPAEQWSAA